MVELDNKRRSVQSKGSRGWLTGEREGRLLSHDQSAGYLSLSLSFLLPPADPVSLRLRARNAATDAPRLAGAVGLDPRPVARRQKFAIACRARETEKSRREARIANLFGVSKPKYGMPHSRNV